jgi:hypothetical protein
VDRLHHSGHGGGLPGVLSQCREREPATCAATGAAAGSQISESFGFVNAVEIKTALIEAHRRQDWPEAARLSQLKERAKRHRHCVVCGVAIGGPSDCRALRCAMHQNIHRYYQRALP